MLIYRLLLTIANLILLINSISNENFCYLNEKFEPSSIYKHLNVSDKDVFNILNSLQIVIDSNLFSNDGSLNIRLNLLNNQSNLPKCSYILQAQLLKQENSVTGFWSTNNSIEDFYCFNQKDVVYGHLFHDALYQNSIEHIWKPSNKTKDDIIIVFIILLENTSSFFVVTSELIRYVDYVPNDFNKTISTNRVVNIEIILKSNNCDMPTSLSSELASSIKNELNGIYKNLNDFKNVFITNITKSNCSSIKSRSFLLKNDFNIITSETLLNSTYMSISHLIEFQNPINNITKILTIQTLDENSDSLFQNKNLSIVNILLNDNGTKVQFDSSCSFYSYMNACQNNGICTLTSRKTPFCQCKSNFIGNFCETQKESLNNDDRIKALVAIVSISSCAVITLIFLLFYVTYKRRKQKQETKKYKKYLKTPSPLAAESSVSDDSRMRHSNDLIIKTKRPAKKKSLKNFKQNLHTHKIPSLFISNLTKSKQSSIQNLIESYSPTSLTYSLDNTQIGTSICLTDGQTTLYTHSPNITNNQISVNPSNDVYSKISTIHTYDNNNKYHLNYGFDCSFDSIEMNKNSNNNDTTINNSKLKKKSSSKVKNANLKATESSVTLKDEDAWLPILNIAEEELKKYQTEKVFI